MTAYPPVCVDCVNWGGVEPNTGKNICKDERNWFFNPVKGGYVTFDATWLRRSLPVEGKGPPLIEGRKEDE